ncbi:protealysin inhibitor emfourin [Spirillospora sp. NPDC047279]|uniref:protealysin inhibitor emfourin n=1 Tax=Spirillospora sp. NPDC047279 TaxID=3155478 RepID=UPI0033C8B276
MQVKIESTGGFAGDQVMVAMYDTADLSEPEAKKIRHAVESLSVAEEAARPGEIGADLPAYRITVDGPDGEHRVFDVEGEHPPALDEPLTILLRGPQEPAAPPQGGRPPKPPSPSGL